jgi:hypothetical protein
MTKLVAAALLAFMRLARADCTAPEVVAAKLAAATKANEAHFAEALKKLKLSPVHLAATRDRQPRESAAKIVVRGGVSTLVLEQPEMSCGGPPPAEFASDGKIVFRIARQELGKPTQLDVCDCTGAPAGCGAEPTPVTTGYVIPPGQHYGGVKRVEYAGELVSVRYGVRQDGPCPQAP